MTKAEQMALSLIPYTCPTLNMLGENCINDMKLNASQKAIFLDFIETIKKDITCPMRVALEQACQLSLENTK